MLKKIFLYVFFSSVLFSCGVIRKTNRAKKKTVTVKKSTGKTPASLKKDIDKNVLYFRVPKNKVGEYIKRYGKIAMEQMERYKIPASITIAQGILESNSGKSRLSRESNNHFGIKCHKGWQGDYARYNDDKQNECFRKYKHPKKSYTDHSLFLTKRSRYRFLFEKRTIDYRFWAKGLKKAGYATDPKYPQKLIKLIERFDLHILDKLVVQGNYKNVVFVAVGKAKNKTKNKTHTIKKGDTLYSLAKKYKTTVEKLKKLNKLSTNDLIINQIIKIN